MTEPGDEKAIYNSILEQVAALYRLRSSRNQFEPGVSKIHYAGRVFDEREMQEVVRASLDFWLTLGPYGAKLEKNERLLSSSGFCTREFRLIG